MRHHQAEPATTLVLAGLLFAFAAGCGRTSAAKQPPATAPPLTVSSSTLPPATTTTVAALPDTTGTDLVKVMQNLKLLLGVAYERVDLSLLDMIYTPDAEQRKEAEKQLRFLLDNGWHYAESSDSVVKDISVKTPLDGVAVVDLVSAEGAQVVKDSSGQVAKTGEGWSPRHERYGLFRGGDGRWRIRDASLLGPA